MPLIFATSTQDWSLLGAPGIFLSLLGATAAWLLSLPSPLADRTRHILVATLPAVMAFGCLWTRWLDSPRAYEAHLDVAFIFSLAFGIAFTLEALRTRELYVRLVGVCFVPIYLKLFAVALSFVGGTHY